MRRLYPLLLLFCSVASFTPSRAQNCAPPAIVANAKSSNFFTPEQETILGGLVFQSLTDDLRIIKNEQLSAYLNALGQRLAKHLPSSGLKYQFYVVDAPEANAYSIPGGYIFVTRKLIGFANNEDELAGVVSHELGHAVVRHGAIDFSEAFRRVLNIKQVGDRADITAKYNEYLEKWRSKGGSGRRVNHENEQQLEADRLGLFAMVAEGYDPNARAAYFDRLVETKGKTGSWFTDLFGTTRPEQKRLREMISFADQVPAQCRASRAGSNAQDFVKWQAEVVAYRDDKRPEELPGLLWKRELSPKLNSDIFHFAFSPDGKYLLAQDDFNITVVQREPLQTLFQIPANDALEANFTQNGRFIVFGTENLRYEKWDLIARKSVAVRELVVRRDCEEHGFSPDGNYLVCLDSAFNLNVLDTSSGKKVWEKKEFYKFTYGEYFSWQLGKIFNEEGDRKLFRIAFSPDSRYMIVSRSIEYRIIPGVFRVSPQGALIALDLPALKPVDTGGDLKTMTQRPFIFLDDKRILATGPKLEDSGIFSFPEGKRLAMFKFGADEIKRTANPDVVVVKPLVNTRLGFFDITRQAVVGGLQKNDASMWSNVTVQEARTGQILLNEVAYDEAEKRFKGTETGRLDIPAGVIGRLKAANLSDNFQWLSFSAKSRGGVWDLRNGERQQFVRGFRNVVLDNDGMAVGEFPKLDDAPHSLVFLNSQTKTADVLRDLPERGVQQFGRFIFTRTSLKPPPKKDKDDGKTNDKDKKKDEDAGPPLWREVRFELLDLLQNKVVWSREFPKEAPQGYLDEYSGRLIFAWDLGSDVGKDKLKEDAQLAARAKEMGSRDDDYLLEVVDAYAGKTIGSLLLETGKGSFSIRFAFSEGDRLVLYDWRNRVLVYSLKSGEVRHRFFGDNAAMNPSRQQIAIENYPGELTVYDLNTGDSQARLTFNGSAVFVRFSLDGKRLFVLSDKQTAYAFDVEKLAALQKATAKN